jgi:hypothetical protein
MNNTPTPRTLAAASESMEFDPLELVVGIDFARQLERKLAEAREQRDAALWCRGKCFEDRKRIIKELNILQEQVRLTIMENLHLADGDNCTLKRLKDAIGFSLDSPENA